MKNKNFILKNVKYFDVETNRILFTKKLFIKDGRISFKSPSNITLYNSIDCKDYTLFPSFIQSHTHICQNLIKGYAEEMQLYEWLKKVVLPYEKNLKKETLSLSCRLSLYELIDSGTTTIVDMGTFENQEIIFEEIENSKITGYSGNVLMDRSFGGVRTGLKHYEEYSRWLIELVKKYKNTKYILCPRFVPGLTEKGIKVLLKLRDEYSLIVHSHSSETISENLFTQKEYNLSNIEFLEKNGILDGKTILAHCIHLSENDRKILKRKNVNVAHCPSANGKLFSGIMDLTGLYREGINVGIGSDGPPCNNNTDQIFEMRLAKHFQNIIYGKNSIKANEIFKMATVNGAKTLGIEKETGSIKENFFADFILVENDINVSSFDKDPSSGFIFSVYPENIKFVFSKGIPLKFNGKVLNYDKTELVKEKKKILKYLFSNRL